MLSRHRHSRALGLYGVCGKFPLQGWEDFQRLKRADNICRGVVTWVRLFLIGWYSECFLEGSLIG